MDRKRLIIVWHSRTGGGEALAAEAAAAARAAEPALAVALRRAEDADAAALLASDAFLFVAPENLAALSGAMKEMFDRSYYACLGRIEGRPYATIICAGSDGAGAQRQIDRIATGWRLRRVAEPLTIVTGAQTAAAIAAPKTLTAAQRAAAAELGAALAGGVMAGIF